MKMSWKNKWAALAFATALAMPFTAAALDNGNIPITARPAWTVPLSIEPGPSIDESLVDYGYYYLLIDQQLNAQTREDYRHYAFRVINNAGLTDASQLQLSWEPSYERFTLHSLVVWRDGKKIDWSGKIRWSEIQKEESLEMLQYNETRTMLLIFEDIRVNDVVEFEYTVTGSNPIFGKKFSGYFSHGYNYPMEYLHFRLLVPRGMDIEHRQHLRNLLFSETTLGDGSKEYTWKEFHSPAVKADDQAPEWFESYPWIEFSEWKDWQEVRSWSEGVFTSATGAGTNGKVRRLADKIIGDSGAGDNDAERLIALLRFVQNEIRYFGIEIGVNSHKPRSPMEVAESRFGDCKDKATLFCELAKIEGWRADCVLVNARSGRSIEGWLPSPFAFNHVIARVTGKDGAVYWFDPTFSHQGGTLGSIYVPDYGWTLPVTNGGTGEPGLQRMTDTAKGMIETYETYETLNAEGEGKLEVLTVYRDKEADSMRWRLASTGRVTLEKYYLDFYQRLFPNASRVGDVSSTDNLAENVIEVRETYSIPQLWKDSKDGNKETLYVYPHTFSQYLDGFSELSAIRKAPLRLYKPYSFSHTISITSMKDLTVGNEEYESDNPWYSLSFNSKREGNTVIIKYAYENLVDSVDAADFSKFRDTVKDDNENWVGYTASTGSSRSRSNDDDSPLIPFWQVYILIASIVLSYNIGFKRGKKR